MCPQALPPGRALEIRLGCDSFSRARRVTASPAMEARRALLAEGLPTLRGRLRRSGSSRRSAPASKRSPLVRIPVGGPQALQHGLGVGHREGALELPPGGRRPARSPAVPRRPRSGRPGPTRPPPRPRGTVPRRSARRPVAGRPPRGSRVSTPPPPIWPKLRWPSAIRALRATRAKSQLSSSSSPPAAVTPLTRATTGTGRSRKTPEHPVDIGHEAGEGDRVPLQRDVALEVASGAERPTGTGEQHATQVVWSA